jgi:hypothetical protein
MYSQPMRIADPRYRLHCPQHARRRQGKRSSLECGQSPSTLFPCVSRMTLSDPCDISPYRASTPSAPSDSSSRRTRSKTRITSVSGTRCASLPPASYLRECLCGFSFLTGQRRGQAKRQHLADAVPDPGTDRARLEYHDPRGGRLDPHG